MKKEQKLPILCIDFDGVLHAYTSGWKGAHIVSDPPVPGAMEFLLTASRDFKIAIFSSRSGQDFGIEAMEDWLRKHLTEYFLLHHESDEWAADQAAMVFLKTLSFPIQKPPAFLTLDDRGITFTGTFPSIQDLLAFRPWNKQI